MARRIASDKRTPDEIERDERRADTLDEIEKKKTEYANFWNPIYDETEKHLRFTLLGKQLEDDEARRLGLRHPKEPNELLTFANRAINKVLQTDYRGKVTPNGGGSDEIKARERQGVLRGLQRVNNIIQIFHQVRRNQVCGGIAYSLAESAYANKRGYGKTLKDVFLDDYRNVFPDIHVKSPTFSDAQDFLIRQDVPKSQWKKKTGQDTDDWGDKKKKELWCYWKKESTEDTEYLGENNQSLMESSLPELKGNKFGGKDLTGVKMDDDGEPLGRPTEDFSWRYYLMADKEIIKEEVWYGSYSPLVACTGSRIDSNGKTYFQGLTQFAEEPQRIYTIIENIIQLRLGKSPFSKWKVAFETIVGKELIALREASEVGDTDIVWLSQKDGKPLPSPEEIEPHLLDAQLISFQDYQMRKMERIFGTSEASFGRKTQEISGIAQERRERASDTTTYHSEFNFLQYVEQVIRVKLDLLPHYMDAQQQAAFIDEEDKTVMAWLNTTGGISFSPDEEFSLAIEAMPISPTAREDEAAYLSGLAQKIPIVANNPRAMAIVIKAQPGRYTAQLADVIGGEDPKVKAAQGMIQQLQGKLQQVTQQAQAQKVQDGIKLRTMQASLSISQKMMGLLKAQHAAEKSANPEAVEDPMLGQMQSTIDAQELEIKRFEAEAKAATDSQNADSRTMDAETNRLKLGHEMSKPDLSQNEAIL